MRPPRPCTTPALARATVVVLLAVLGLLGTGAGPAAAADGDASWTVGTAAGDFGSGRENYRYTLDPGGRLQDGLVIVNHGATPLHLAVYAADAFTAEGGRLDLAAKDATSTKVGAWVHADRPDVTVAPGGSAEVPFTVALPDDAAPGEYMGGIVTAPAGAGEGDGRLGIRIRLRVGGALKPGLSAEDLRVRYSGTPDPFGKGEATVTYTVRNTGNAILAARQAVSLSGPFGRFGVRAGQIGDSPQLLPGDTWKVSVPVRGVTPALRLTGTVALTPLLTDAANSVAPLAVVQTTADAWTIPWTLLLLVLIVVCGLTVAALAIRRRRRTRPARTGSAAALRPVDQQDSAG
ncbi:WxL protein peptidoglycan domain-containing protein [Sphaerisporangium rhizosphaerae]|uniref:WxL protein peptidoglycan domain-containing protein n=1 Tax=Sphaerisporangium rhizosphaerae TaxID=2269375 RepID=A0ABW2NZI5_9ACTN